MSGALQPEPWAAEGGCISVLVAKDIALLGIHYDDT